jgi:hypothetical protein
MKDTKREASGASPWVAAAAAAFLVLGAGAAAETNEDDARAILLAMADYLGAQPAIAFTFDSDIEVVTPELEKIQFTSSGEALLSRPDHLKAHRVGGYADVEMYYDGKALSIFSKNLNGYATFEGEGNVDQLIVSLRSGLGVAMPGADLLISKPYDILMADVLEAKHIGRGVIDGVETEHLAFRNFDADWQLWVEVGDKPIPRKLVITSKTIAGAPQYTLRIKDFDTDVRPSLGDFAFAPPRDARELTPEDLMKLDELPEGAPAGGGQK